MIALLVCLACLYTRPLVARISSHILHGPDPAIYVWQIDWLSGHLLQPSQLFEGNIYAPARNAVVLSDLALGTAILVAPLRIVVRDPVPLYNCAVLAALVFGAWSFYRLVLHLTNDVAAGVLSGILAAFAAHQMEHVYQLGLISVGWLAVFLWFLHRLLRAPRIWNAPLVGVAFALNVLSSGYFAVAGVVLAVVFAVVHFRELFQRRMAVLISIAIGTSVVLLIPYVTAYSTVRRSEDLARPIAASYDLAFKPNRDLGSTTYVYGRWLKSRGECLFPGVACLVAAAIALVRRVPGRAPYAGGFLALVALSIGPWFDCGGFRITLPYRWLFDIPPFDGMLHPYTFAAVALFCLAVLAGLGFASLVHARAVSLRLGIAIVIGVVETARPGVWIRPVAAGVPAIYRALEDRPGGPLLEIPVGYVDTLIWAARHKRPVVNGAGAMAPRNHVRLERWIMHDWIKARPEAINIDVSRPTALIRSHFRVRYLIVPSGRDPRLGHLPRLIDRSRVFRRLAEIQGDVVYEYLAAEHVHDKVSGEAPSR